MIRTSLAVLLAVPFLIGTGEATLRTNDQGKPVMMGVYPAAARPGAVLAISGARLDAFHVRAVYLRTERDSNFAMEIVEQNNATLLLRIPSRMPAGRMRVTVEEAFTRVLIEEPVFVDVLPPTPVG